MNLCEKFIIVIMLSAIVQVSSADLEKENAELNEKVLRLEEEIVYLNMQIKELSIERQNCTTFADNIYVISESLTSIQQEIKPLSEHFHMGKAKTEYQRCFDELKTAKKELITAMVQANNITISLNTCLNKLMSAVKPENCREAAKGHVGVFIIQTPGFYLTPFHVYCESDDWMIILRRVDDTVDFQRDWTSYRDGFGDIGGNYIMGLQKIHQLTTSQCHEMMVTLEDFENNTMYALYDQFAIDDETNGYALKTLGKHSGTIRDALVSHVGMKFTTIDKDNDLRVEGNCAEDRIGGWWYTACTDSHLTGRYILGGIQDNEGIMWNDKERPYYSYKFAEMKIRPTTC